jgi:hypothetical protein
VDPEKPMRSCTFAGLVLVLLAVACTPSEPKRLHSDFRIGMAKETVLEQFGPPDAERRLTRDSEAIWGPIEDFWSKVPDGSVIEIWSYKTRARLMNGSSDLSPGTTELYFVDDSATVDGIGFAPEGAVYEAGGPR